MDGLQTQRMSLVFYATTEVSSCDLRSNEMPNNKISSIHKQIEQIAIINYQKKAPELSSANEMSGAERQVQHKRSLGSGED